MDWSDRIGRRVKLRDLHILLAVAEHGSMTKASTKLAISHPVVSKTISELEQTLGVKLLNAIPRESNSRVTAKRCSNAGSTFSTRCAKA